MGVSRAESPAKREPGGDRVPRYFPIGEIARRTGMTARTIRYYEDIGLLASVRRVEGGRRVYTEDDIRRLKFVLRLKVLGLTLEEMKELEDLYLTHRSNDRVLPHLLELLDRHLAAIEARIEQLTVLKRDIQDYKQHIRSKI